MCWLLVFLDGVDTFIYGAVLPDMLGNGHLGLTDATAGAIGSYTTFGMLIGTIASGIVSNWIGRKTTVLISISTFALATLVRGLSVTATMLGFATWPAVSDSVPSSPSRSPTAWSSPPAHARRWPPASS